MTQDIPRTIWHREDLPLHAAAILILMIVQFALLGYGYGMPIHSELVPHYEQARNPELFVRDWRIQTNTDPVGLRWGYIALHNAILDLFPGSLPLFELLFFLIIGTLRFTAFYAIAFQLFRDWKVGVLSAILVIVFKNHLNNFDIFLRGPVITSYFAETLILWALVLFPRRPFLFALVGGFVTYLHLATGSQMMLAYGLVNLFPLNFDRRWVMRQTLLVVGFLIGSLLIWVHLPALLDNAAIAGDYPYATELLSMRAPWHFDYFRSEQALLEFALYVGIFFYFAWSRSEPEHQFVRRLFIAMLILVMMNMLLSNPIVRLDLAINFDSARMAQYLIMFALMYLADGLLRTAEKLSSTWSPLLVIPGIGILLFMLDPKFLSDRLVVTDQLYPDFYLFGSAIVFFVLIRWRYLMRTDKTPLYAQLLVVVVLAGSVMSFAWHKPLYVWGDESAAASDDMSLWIESHTPVDAIFVVNPFDERFKHLAERATIVEWRFLPYPFYEEWLNRVFDVLGIQPQPGETPLPYIEKLRSYEYWDENYFDMSESRAKLLHEKYDASYLLIIDSVHLDFPVMHECCGLILYDISDD